MALGKNRFQLFILCTLLLTFVLFSGPVVFAAPPTLEWTFHKTRDSSHPDGNEQQMVWLMNRARSNPGTEGRWLASSPAADVAGSRDYFGVDTQLLQAEFSQYAAKPPAAFDVRLYAAAEAHCQDLIARNAQDHVGQFEAVAENGFTYTAARGNVFFYAESALNAHAAFNIDWSFGTSGMTSGRGHRMAVMSIDGDYTNVGLAVVEKPNSGPFNGRFAVTGNYCRASTRAQNHFNRFLVGTIWSDHNANEIYDPGEGVADITVEPDHGTYYAISADGGGYTIPISESGSYRVTFRGAALAQDITRSVTVGDESVLLDLQATQTTTPPDGPGPTVPQVTTGSARQITAASAILTGSLIAHGQRTTFHFQYGLPAGDMAASANGARSTDGDIYVTVTGLLPDTTYAYRSVATNSDGTAYGQTLVFQTLPAADQEADAPAPDTDAPSDANAESDDSSGDTQDSGGCFIGAIDN